MVKGDITEDRTLGDGCTTLRIYSVSLNHLKMAKVVHFILCVFYYNKKLEKIKSEKPVVGWTWLGLNLLAPALVDHNGCIPLKRFLVYKREGSVFAQFSNNVT